MFYTVGENIPGYLPEGDTYTTESADYAAQYALSLVDTYCDSLSEQYERDDERFPEGETPDNILAHAAASLADEFRSRPDLGWSFHAEDPNMIHDLGLSFWINASEEPPDGWEEE